MKPYVLVVEDNQIECLRLSKILEVGGYIPIVVNDGITALEACDKYNIDAGLVDIQMPHMSGFEFLQRLQRMKKSIPFPIVMMTASRHETRHIKEAIELGARDFIVKPIDPQIVTTKLSGLLKNRVEWAERKISESGLSQQAQVSFPLQIESISEMGIRVLSGMPMEMNRFVSLNWSVLIEAEVGSVNLKVLDCEQVTGGYSIYLGFLGLPEIQLKKLRQICLKAGLSQRFAESS